MTTMDGTDLRFDFAALPERIWEAMTNPTKAAAWLPDGLAAEIGRRFTLPGSGLSGEVIAVDPPSRVALRWRQSVSGRPLESVMTWVVARAPGGSSVRVILSPVDDPAVAAELVAAELVAALRTLFDERLRSVLRGHAPASISPPALLPAEALPSPPVLVDVATPVGALGGPGLAVVEGRSQAVSLWPVLRKAKGRPKKSGTRRRTGTALAYRLVAVIAIAAAVAAITFGASAIPWANAPGESTLGDDVAATGSPAIVDAAQPNLDTNTRGSAATAAPATTNSTTSGSGTPAVPPPIPPLTVSLEIVNELLGYSVLVTITNPAGSPQSWQNLTVHIEGVPLLTVLGSLVALLLPGNDPCLAPTVATSVGAGQTLQFSFKVTGALGQPTQAKLNQGGC